MSEEKIKLTSKKLKEMVMEEIKRSRLDEGSMTSQQVQEAVVNYVSGMAYADNPRDIGAMLLTDVLEGIDNLVRDGDIDDSIRRGIIQGMKNSIR